jgi:peptide/nickel transport system substrate-binding protein
VPGAGYLGEVFRRWGLLFLLLAACGSPAGRRGATVLYASGADLQSVNPLLTVHPLARQVERYVLLTTLVRYDSTLALVPYLARSWRWSLDHRSLFFRLRSDLRWSDGVGTTAGDAAWTLNAAHNPATGYPRLADLGQVSAVSSPDDTTLVIRFAESPPGIPDVLTDLAILPRHLLDTVPPEHMRQASWNFSPVGNGPFRFVRHEPNRRWVFEANPGFPAGIGGPPKLSRLIIVVVDEPITKLAALTSGELDFAGISPAHAGFIVRDPDLALLDYPILFTYGVVFNTRHPPFNDVGVRRRVSEALDREELVAGYAYGFAKSASGPVPAEAVGAATSTLAPASTAPSARSAPLAFTLLTVGSGDAVLEQLIQAQLARAGFRVTIRQMELSAYLDRVYGAAHEFEAAVLGVSGDLGLGYLQSYGSISGIGLPPDSRGALQMLADSMPVAFLYHARAVQGMNRRVHGVKMDLRGEFATVQRWWVDQP